MPKCNDLSLWRGHRRISFIVLYGKEFLILSKDSSVSPIWKKIKKTGSSLQIHNFKDILIQIRMMELDGMLLVENNIRDTYQINCKAKEKDINKAFTLV